MQEIWTVDSLPAQQWDGLSIKRISVFGSEVKFVDCAQLACHATRNRDETFRSSHCTTSLQTLWAELSRFLPRLWGTPLTLPTLGWECWRSRLLAKPSRKGRRSGGWRNPTFSPIPKPPMTLAYLAMVNGYRLRPQLSNNHRILYESAQFVGKSVKSSVALLLSRYEIFIKKEQFRWPACPSPSHQLVQCKLTPLKYSLKLRVSIQGTKKIIIARKLVSFIRTKVPVWSIPRGWSVR